MNLNVVSKDKIWIKISKFKKGDKVKIRGKANYGEYQDSLGYAPFSKKEEAKVERVERDLLTVRRPCSNIAYVSGVLCQKTQK